MTAAASSIMENYTYNLTSIVNADIINDPSKWLFNFNGELGGVMIVSFLAVFAIVLFMLAYNIGGIKHTKAAVYSGLITSIIGVLLFFVETEGNKLLTFPQLMIFLVVTALAILVDRIARNY